MKKKVLIGMSGGVDSSVAAAVLLEQGYDVVGVTMRLWDGEERDGSFTEGTCCSLSAVEDARRVAYKLGIDYHVLDFRSEFDKHVVDYFTSEYQCGRTPNPCIACNKYIKFDAMLQKAEMLGADYVATGHYAKVEFDRERGRYLLKKSNALRKDQTYALYGLTQQQLSRIVMPLGDVADKETVRQKAAELELPVADKPDSQEICFVPDKDYAGFITRRAGDTCQKGNFVDTQGNVLGEHNGIIHYTVGQRKGLGITFGKPMFVIKIDPQTNEIMLGEKGSEFSDCLYANRLNFIPFERLQAPLRVQAKIRYSAQAANAQISMIDEDLLRVVFDAPQRAVTPGQAVVFYEPEGDTVIGGGLIV